MDVQDLRRKHLKELPHRKWDNVKSYSSLLVVHSGKKHDSGWSCIYVVGVEKREVIEIAASSADDLCFNTENLPVREGFKGLNYPMFRADCTYPSGFLHLWGRGVRFEVGCALSSTDIRVYREDV